MADNRDLDKEWVELIKEALEFGITVKEIREFIEKSP
ncbi:anti-repressor SinI family protein [Bacillus sp. SD088]|nr:anti-repressor SinI family protein [Bacillus sp. SD088]MBO0995677.1 anti-repressor SinI family protein [Bacillus sp. SD088]